MADRLPAESRRGRTRTRRIRHVVIPVIDDAAEAAEAAAARTAVGTCRNGAATALLLLALVLSYWLGASVSRELMGAYRPAASAAAGPPPPPPPPPLPPLPPPSSRAREGQGDAPNAAPPLSPSPSPATDTPTLAGPGAPLIYLHLHKAAGTLACELLRQSSLRLNKVKSLNCNCQVESEDLLNRRNPRKGGILRLVQTGNGVELRAELRRRRWDACFVEVANFWPKPEQLAELARHVRLGVMLREPWSRHESQYERDYFKAGLLAGPQSPGRYPPCPIESYSKVGAYAATGPAGPGCNAQSSQRYAVEGPNFYVRTLSGQTRAADQWVRDTSVPLTEKDLGLAIEALRYFELATVLEGGTAIDDLVALAGPKAWPRGTGSVLQSRLEELHPSNNPWSDGGQEVIAAGREPDAGSARERAAKAVPREVLAAREASRQGLRERWLEENALDVALYNQVVGLVVARNVT